MLIACRNGFAVKGWKNPYPVMDSCVAWWDGEWNAGKGKHDASLGGCVNIMSPGSFDTTEIYTYFTNGDDYGEVSADNPYWSLPSVDGSIQQRIATAWISQGDGVTIEMLYNNSGDGSYSRWLCATGGGGAGAIGNGGCALCGVGLKSYRNEGYDFRPGVWNLQTVTVNKDGYKFYVNGNLVDTQSNPSFNPNQQYGKYMSFPNGAAFQFRSWRFHLRMFTAAEIAANYAVDQQRFNLS